MFQFFSANALAAISTILFPMASDAVAPGEGALRT
jgi:hypothetical protein